MAYFDVITTARFWSKVNIPISKSACWEWRGGKCSAGYGTFRAGPSVKVKASHRISYSLFHGEEPEDGMCIRHTCDNPGCVNPNHLLIGTQRDNVADMLERKRVSRVGEKNGRHKLCEADVINILNRVNLGHRSKDIAATYGVSAALIGQIKSGRAWPHVKARLSNGSGRPL